MPLPTPSFSLAGKRALVTGAGRGIGKDLALALAGAGAHVTLLSRTAAELDAVADEIRAGGGTADCIAVDITDVEATAAALAGHDPWDVLVNNAGTNQPEPFTEIEPATFDRIMDLNLRAAFFVAQAVARKLVDAGKPGAIVNISSQMGHVGGRNRTVYCASKHALEGLTKAMALDLAEHGVRVNTVGPTFIETPLTKPFFENKAFLDDTLSRIPLGHLGSTADVAGAVVFLASDAAALITGTSLLVDGGWTAV
jgi:NAD(P)-dependent dehydrogenase (short-subunit alcohol dehydrogenase family)